MKILSVGGGGGGVATVPFPSYTIGAKSHLSIWTQMYEMSSCIFLYFFTLIYLVYWLLMLVVGFDLL